VAGLAAAFLTVGTAWGFLAREWILATVFFIGAARAFESPTSAALLPALVPPPLLARAVAASSAAGPARVIVGPAVGGLLYAVSPVLVHGVCGVLYLVGSLLIVTLPVARYRAAREPITVERLFAGIAFIRQNPIVLGAITLDLFAVLLGGATALLPIFARDILLTVRSGRGVPPASTGMGPGG